MAILEAAEALAAAREAGVVARHLGQGGGQSRLLFQLFPEPTQPMKENAGYATSQFFRDFSNRFEKCLAVLG